MQEYYSQYGQDKFLNEVLFKKKRNGVFIDVGANDGITISNTYYFEKNLNWTGICLEPLTNAYGKLKENRTSVNINGCASYKNYLDTFFNVTGYGEMLSGLKSQYDSRHIERINKTLAEHGGTLVETEVQCYDLNELLIKNNFRKIDFISIDTEGGELKILKALDYKELIIKAIVIENNYDETDIFDFMRSKGFYRVAYLSTDEIYLHPRNFGNFNSFLIKCELKLDAMLVKLRKLRIAI